MVKLTRYLSGYSKQCVLAPLFKLLEAAFNLLVPFVMASIVDKGISTGDVNHIYFCAVLLVGMAIIGWICAALAQYFCAQLASGFGTALRSDLFAHILTFSKKEIDSFGAATLITRINNDTNQIQDGVNLFFRLVLRCPIVVFGAIISAFIVSGPEGGIFTLICALFFLFVWLVMRIAVKRYRIVQNALDKVLLSVKEQLEGVRVLRAFSREEQECKDFEVTVGTLREKQISAGDVASLMNPLTYVTVNLGLVAVLYVAGIQINIGSLTQGQAVALVNYVSQMLVDLMRFATLIMALSKAEACAKRVNEIFATSSSMVDGTVDASGSLPSVEACDVSFTYPDASAPALSHISFSINPGEIVGIIGGTGSGKSTLASLLMRAYDPTEGALLLGGKKIENYEIKTLHKLVNIVDQKPHLFSGTIASNLKLADKDADEPTLENAVTWAQAREIVDSKGGFNSRVEQLGKNFSGGQRQRLSIARTLVRKPQILILDDASSALDLATDARLRKSLKENLEGTTQIIITQRISAISHADKILVMDAGIIVGQGTHKELLETCEVYREICASQLKSEEM